MVIARCRMPMEVKMRITGGTLPVVSYTEIEIHNNVMKAFQGELIECQYRVGKYRIDMYFVEHKVAVECDEHAHASYNQDKEAMRTTFITDALQCKWIRYNPYDRDFCIFRLISDIRRLTMRPVTML